MLSGLTAHLKNSIKRQLIVALMGLMLFGVLLLAIVFYFQSRSVALSQMRESYKNLGIMVAKLSSYDIQFNRSALKQTAQRMADSDSSLLWVQVVDADGKSLGSAGKLKVAPYKTLPPLKGTKGAIENITTPKGDGILVRTPIGTVISSSGSLGELGFETPQPAVRGAVKKKALGELRLVVDLAPLSQLKRRYLAFGALILALVFVVGLVVSIAITRYFTAPIFELTEYARKIAAGNLHGFKGTKTRQDELGLLVASFQEMTENLIRIVQETREAFHRVEDGTESVKAHLSATLENTKEQEAGSTEVRDKVGSIQLAVDQIAKLMEGLSALAEEVSSSVLEMIASIDEIASNTESLNDALNTSASTLTQNVAANKQIDASAEQLNRFVEETSSAMTEMEGSIRQIDENASNTRQATERVAEEAKSGIRAIQQSNESMEELRRSFENTAVKMSALGKESREAGNILAVIDEVMEQTHLLALNAAIIAAQAGERGKPFAVVASEIKELATKTSVSTGEIAEIINAVQSGVKEVVDSVAGQRDLVVNTAEAYGEAAKVFSRIKEGVEPSLQMVQEIARATAEQTKGAASIVKATEQLRELAHQLRQATKEQALGSEQILEAQNRISALSEEMKRGISEQSTGSALIRKAMDRLTSSVTEVLSQTQDQRRAGKVVDKTMGVFARRGKASVASLEEAADQMDALATRAEEASSIFSHFKIGER